MSDVVKEVDTLADTYLHKVRSFSSDRRKQQLATIQKLFRNGHEFCNDKVQLAMQTYELVSLSIVIYGIVSKSAFIVFILVIFISFFSLVVFQYVCQLVSVFFQCHQ